MDAAFWGVPWLWMCFWQNWIFNMFVAATGAVNGPAVFPAFFASALPVS